MNLGYAVDQLAPRERPLQFAGLLSVAACLYAHAIVASRGHWVTNEKTLVDRAGLRSVARELGGALTDQDSMLGLVAMLRAAAWAELGTS